MKKAIELMPKDVNEILGKPKHTWTPEEKERVDAAKYFTIAEMTKLSDSITRIVAAKELHWSNITFKATKGNTPSLKMRVSAEDPEENATTGTFIEQRITPVEAIDMIDVLQKYLQLMEYGEVYSAFDYGQKLKTQEEQE